MPDQYVKALAYDIRHAAWIDYGNTQPATITTEDFDVRVADGEATFEFKTKDLETEAQALEAVSDFISQWEFSASLQLGPEAFTLRSPRAEFKEQNPVPGMAQLRGNASTGPVRSEGDLTVTTHPPSYPEPPSTGIKITPDVQAMFDRYVDCLNGQGRLDSMAYFCLTVLQAAASREPGFGRSRWKASKAYGVSRAVLTKVAKLSSGHGRKADGKDKPLNDGECRFLQEATESIIRRMAENAFSPDTDLPEITMADLPPLP